MTHKIYHNPRCPVSRRILQTMQDKGLNPVVIHYMQDPLPRVDLIDLLNTVRLSPKDLIRPRYARRIGLDTDGLDLTKTLEALAKNPMLMKRPIVVTPHGGGVCQSIADLDEMSRPKVRGRK